MKSGHAKSGRDSLTLGVLQNQEKKDLVLIDDDPGFGLSVVYAARRAGLSIDCFTNLLEMGSIARFENYRVAILDYNLEHMSGLEVAEYFPVFFEAVPVLLISQSTAEEIKAANQWPSSIRAYVNKAEGAQAVIEAALKLKGTDEGSGSGSGTGSGGSGVPVSRIDEKREAYRDQAEDISAVVDLCHGALARLDFRALCEAAKRLSKASEKQGDRTLGLLACRLKVHAAHQNLSVTYTLVRELDAWVRSPKYPKQADHSLSQAAFTRALKSMGGDEYAHRLTQ